MLDFLKESTFRANDVIVKALHILRKYYFSIAGLCFSLFLVSQLAAFLPQFFDNINLGVKVFLMLVTIVVFFGLQLILIKRAILLSHGVIHANLIEYFPSTKQFFNFLFGLILCSFLGGILTLIVGVLCFPLVYFNYDIPFIVYDVVPTISGIIGVLFLVRITFFPFFILERNINLLQALKLSIAFTKGNYFRLLTVFFMLGLTSLISFLLLKFGYWYIAMFFGGISIFIIIPLVSLAMSIVYVDMIKEYKGGDNPELFKNIF